MDPTAPQPPPNVGGIQPRGTLQNGMGFLNADFSAPKPEAPAGDAKSDTVADNLGSILDSRFTSWRDMRREVEEGWIKDLRQFNGIYEPSVLQLLANRSKIFVRLTRTKTLGAYSRIIDLLLGHDRHWSIAPTPIAKLDPAREQELMDHVMQIDPAGVAQMPPDAMKEVLLEMEKDLAKKSAERMETQIDDQLIDEKYESLFKIATMEMCLLGTGCIKGPVVKVAKTKRWIRNPLTGAYALVIEEKPAPGLTAPSIFDTYPDPFCTSVEEGVGVYERHVMTAEHLRGLGDYPGFNADAIEQIIGYYPTGNHTDLQHEIDRREIAKMNSAFALNKRYDVMEYWGQVTGEQLSVSGLEVHADRLTDEIQSNIWFCGARTIKVQFNPLTPERIPYQFARYEKIPHQFWGIGVPRQMVDSQDMLNSSVRTLLDNQAICSGPQVEVNSDLLAQGQDPRAIVPWGTWVRSGGDGAQPLLRFHDIPSHLLELIRVAELFRKFMDEETSQPSYTHGDEIPGLNKTASGMSMLMGAAQISTKGVIKNLDDDMIAPTMRGMYDWNMRWNDREDIKGDQQVDARGSTALLAKEMQSQRLLQYAQVTANPMDAQLMGPKKRSKLLREIAVSLDLNPDEVAPDEDQFNATGPAAGPGNGPPGSGGGAVPVQPPAMGTAAPPPGAPA